jgi:NifU-like protein involved in Fe-S cluster formation
MALYTTEILRLASSLVAGDRLIDPDGTAECRSPICGSRIIAEVNLSDDRIEHLAIRASACAMGQASAAIVRANAAGMAVTDLIALRAAIEAFLHGKADIPPIWPQLMALSPARDYPARHAAIMLPYDAVLAAAQSAQSLRSASVD